MPDPGSRGWRRSALPLVAAAMLMAVGCSAEGVGSVGGEPSDEVVALGSLVYQASCASCHGAAGEGQPGWQSPRSDGTYPAPPHDSTGHTWHHPDELLIDIIRRGGQVVYGRPGFTSGMPAFGDQLTDAEIRAVLAYIKTFWGEDERAFQERITQ